MLTPDKRDHYRLHDRIDVDYRRVAHRALADTAAEDYFETSPAFRVIPELYRLDLEAREMLRGFADREIADFLTNLGRRVELLARALTSAERDGVERDLPAKISQGGISFPVKDLFDTGTLLALKLQFRDSMLTFAVFAEVRHCRLSEDGERYIVGTRFLDLDPSMEELLQRYIIHRQAEERRARLRSHR